MLQADKSSNGEASYAWWAPTAARFPALSPYGGYALCEATAALFLLLGGRPGRRFSIVPSLTFAIQAGGRPLRFAPPAASRSRLRIASPNCSRSKRSSARILLMSIIPPRLTPFRLAIFEASPLFTADISHWNATGWSKSRYRVLQKYWKGRVSHRRCCARHPKKSACGALTAMYGPPLDTLRRSPKACAAVRPGTLSLPRVPAGACVNPECTAHLRNRETSP